MNTFDSQAEKKVLAIKLISGFAALAIIIMSVYNTVYQLPYYMQTLASFYLMYTLFKQFINIVDSLV